MPRLANKRESYSRSLEKEFRFSSFAFSRRASNKWPQKSLRNVESRSLLTRQKRAFIAFDNTQRSPVHKASIFKTNYATAVAKLASLFALRT